MTVLTLEHPTATTDLHGPVTAFRTADAAVRDVLLTAHRTRRLTVDVVCEAITRRAEACAAFRTILVHDEALAVLLAAERAYLTEQLLTHGRRRAHDDPGRAKYRRAVAAWLAPQVYCTTCCGRLFEVTPGVWLAYDGYTARCDEDIRPHTPQELTT